MRFVVGCSTVFGGHVDDFLGPRPIGIPGVSVRHWHRSQWFWFSSSKVMGVVHKHLFDLHEDSHDFGATNLAQISQAELSE